MIENGADIQVEHGNWAKVHNGILEHLALIKMDGREAKCLFYLLRMTYGKQVKEQEISLTLWAEGTNLDKRHVKPILDKLIRRRIIYRIEGKQGRGHTSTYGFNKYFELWDKPEKVPSTVPIKKVPHTVPFGEEKVPSTVPEKVPSTVPTIERSSKGGLLAANHSDDVMGLIRLAYEAVCGFGPPMQSDEGKTNLAIASDLIERYSYAQCVRGISTLKERNYAQVKKNSRNTIRAPVKYLKAIMEDDFDEAIPTTIVLDFALEDITQ